MSAFEDGYRTFARNVGVSFAMLRGDAFFQYVSKVEDAARKSIAAIHAFRYAKDGTLKGGRHATYFKTLKGNLAETLHAEEFNLDAVAKNSDLRAIVQHSTARNSVDILIKSDLGLGKIRGRVQVKCYDTASHTDRAFRLGRYRGQKKLVPAGQLKVRKSIDHLAYIDENGVTVNSRPHSIAELEKCTQDLLDHGKISNQGFDALKAIKDARGQNIFASEIFKAGLTAAVISVVFEVAPALISVIENLMHEGKVDADDFNRVGFAALKGSSLGFVRGSVAAALTIACTAGKFGTALKAADPMMIGAAVALTMNTLHNATRMAFGKLSKREFANKCTQDLFATSCSIALGSAVQLLLPQLPTLGFMLGSFIGSVLGSFVYNTAYSCVISFCVDTGCTFFGLVEQDYTLPEEVLKEIGIDVFAYDKFVPKQVQRKRFEPKRFEVRSFTAKNIDIVFLRRGVIGVNCVGYV